LAPRASPGKKCWHVIRFNELEANSALRRADYACRVQRHRQELRKWNSLAFPPLVLRCSSGRPVPGHSYKTRHDDRTRRCSPRRHHLRSYERQEIPVRTTYISASWPPGAASPPVLPTSPGITGLTSTHPPAYSASRPPIIADTTPTGYDSKPIA